MATRIYPVFSSDIDFGDKRGSLELDFVTVSESSEYDKLDICIDGKGPQNGSFVAMTLTISDAEILIKLLEEQVMKCKNDVIKYG